MNSLPASPGGHGSFVCVRYASLLFVAGHARGILDLVDFSRSSDLCHVGPAESGRGDLQRVARYQRSSRDSRLVAYPIKVASHPRRTGAALIVDPPGPVPSVRTQARFPGRLCTKRINNLDSASRTAHSQSQPCDQRGFCLAPYPTVSGVMHLLSRWGALYMRVLLLSIGSLIIFRLLTTMKLAGTIRSYEQR